PVTAEGVISRLTPLPFDVLMVVSSNTHSVPSAVGAQSGLRFPVLELSVHTVGLTAASKLPLLCAKAIGAARRAPAAPKIINVFVMRPPFNVDEWVIDSRVGARMGGMKLRPRVVQSARRVSSLRVKGSRVRSCAELGCPSALLRAARTRVLMQVPVLP